MNPPSPPLANPADLTSLAQACLDQLAREEIVLEALANAGEELHTALLSSDDKTLHAAQVRNEELANSLLTMLRQERAALRQRMALALGCHLEQTTVRLLTSRVQGSLSDQLSAARERTRVLAEKVDSFTKRNAALAGYCLGFVQRCLSDATGTVRVGSRYGSAGTMVGASRGSLIEARG